MSNSRSTFVYRNYPLVPIRLCYKSRRTPVIDALLDSGGDFIVIPSAIAKYLDAEVEKAGSVDTAGGTTHLFKTNIDLIIGYRNNEIAYKNLEIFIADRDDIPVLIGRKPFFEDYEITFRKHKQELILNKIN